MSSTASHEAYGMPSFSNSSAKPIMPRPFFRVAAFISSITLMPVRLLSMASSRKRVPTRAACASPSQSIHPSLSSNVVPVQFGFTNFTRFMWLRLQTSNGLWTVSAHGLTALHMYLNLYPATSTSSPRSGFEALRFALYMRPGSPESQAPSAISRKRSRASTSPHTASLGASLCSSAYSTGLAPVLSRNALGLMRR